MIQNLDLQNNHYSSILMNTSRKHSQSIWPDLLCLHLKVWCFISRSSKGIDRRAALSQWKLENTTNDNHDEPTVQQYDVDRNKWRNRDKVVKCLGLFSYRRFQKDWSAAQQNETLRDAATWILFKQYMTHRSPCFEELFIPVINSGTRWNVHCLV